MGGLWDFYLFSQWFLGIMNPSAWSCVDMTTYKLRERVAPFSCSHTLLGGRNRAGDLLFNPEQNEWMKVVLNCSVSMSTPILYLHKFLRTCNTLVGPLNTEERLIF